MSILNELGRSIRRKMINKTADDLASGLYNKAKGTARKVVEEVTDEENHERAREAVRNLGHEARRMSEEALQTLGFDLDTEPPPADPEGESLRERLKREMEQGD